MKKTLLLVLILLSLWGCKTKEGIDINLQNKYLDMIDSIRNTESFEESNSCFNISTDLSKGDKTNRFYIIIDSPQIAMYDIEAVAIEENVDYTNTMAACVGIFEETEYSMVPKQVNSKEGYVKGISISGLTDSDSPVLYMMIQWKNKDHNETYKHFIKVDILNSEER